MAAWQLSESRGLGASDRVWRLNKEGDGLTVGRATYCDIQILSQSVEKKHSVIKWDERKESYVIHDLGSSNGTFLNDLPLSSGVATLRHGDILRFGYDKGHLFHVKKIEPPPPPPAGSCAPPPHLSTPPPSSASSSSTQTSPEQLPTPQQVTGGVQYVPIASPSASILLPPGQPYLLPQPIYAAHVPHIGHVTSHMTGHMTTTSPLVAGYVSPYGSTTPLPSTPLHLLPSYPLTSHPPPHTTHHDRDTPSFDASSSSQPQLLSGRDLGRTNSLRNAGEKEGSNKTEAPEKPGAESREAPVSLPPRRDGRRPISLSSANMPRLSEVSSLYGRPSWWVGDGEEETPVVTNTGGDLPRKPAKRSEPQILRDISPPPLGHSGSFPAQHQLSNRPTTGSREGARGSTSDLETNPSSETWTVETGPRRSRAVPPRWKRHIRSADSSPIRTPTPSTGSKNRSVSPNITPVRSARHGSGASSNTRDSTPLSQRMTASKSSSTSSSSSSSLPRQRPRVGNSPVRRVPRSSSLRTPRTQQQPSGKSEKRSKSKQNRLEIVETQSSKVRAEKSNAAVEDTVEVKVAPGSPPIPPDSGVSSGRDGIPCDQSSAAGREGLRSQSETLLPTAAAGSSETLVDETFVVTSPTDEDEERASSARKTWKNQPQQNSLMMASIEARMKRLDKMAQKTFLSLSSLERETGVAQSVVCSSPLPPTTETHHMPEWKFFDKEVDSIFKSIRSVEKWLRDIDATVGRLQLQQHHKQEEEEEEGEVGIKTQKACGEGEEESGERGTGEGKVEGEQVDFPVFSTGTSESEGAEFHDSIEEGGGVGNSD